MALAHFEGAVVKAIDAHYVTGTDGAGWTADESLALRHFLAALEYPLNPEYATPLEILRAWSRKGGVVAVENTILGGTWTPEGWNGIPDCRFIPDPHLSQSELEDLDPDSDRGRAPGGHRWGPLQHLPPGGLHSANLPMGWHSPPRSPPRLRFLAQTHRVSSRHHLRYELHPDR
ncbi:unnamed protein product [Symbiodinium sp. KB8]|nr:unnamed protein product [Symbiodinium sp. KB8]